MSDSVTVEDTFERGAIYSVDFQRIAVTCKKCGRSFMFTAKRGDPVCNNCGTTVQYESRQTGERPHVVLGHQDCLGYNSTVVAVPLSKTEFAKALPWSIEINPTPSNGLRLPSYALPTKVRCVNKTSFFKEKKLGNLSEDDARRVEEAISITLLRQDSDS